MLRIKGEKKYEREEKEKGQYRMERSYGSFERAIELLRSGPNRKQSRVQEGRASINPSKRPEHHRAEENPCRIVGRAEFRPCNSLIDD